MKEVTLAEFSFTATINAPIEKIDLPAWIFGLPNDEYQRCSPAHVATGATYSPDGRLMAINVGKLLGFPTGISGQHQDFVIKMLNNFFGDYESVRVMIFKRTIASSWQFSLTPTTLLEQRRQPSNKSKLHLNILI